MLIKFLFNVLYSFVVVICLRKSRIMKCNEYSNLVFNLRGVVFVYFSNSFIFSVFQNKYEIFEQERVGFETEKLREKCV